MIFIFYLTTKHLLVQHMDICMYCAHCTSRHPGSLCYAYCYHKTVKYIYVRKNLINFDKQFARRDITKLS